MVGLDELIEQYADSFLSAGEISKLLDADRNTIQKWHRAGKVRMMRVENAKKHQPFKLYHVGDCISARLKHRKPKPFKYRSVDGVVEYCCNTCDVWKPRDDFYEDKRNKYHGILSQCKECHNRLARERNRTKLSRDADRERSKRLMRERADAARAATEWAANPTIPAKLVADAINRVRPGVTDALVSLEAGMHEDTIRNVRRKADRDAMMFLSTVDTIFTNLNERDVFYEITSMLDDVRPRWHKNYDYCQMCLRTVTPFVASGLCSTCYRHRKDPDYRPVVESDWSIRFVRCQSCQCTDSKHSAHGLCRRCYQMHRKRNTLHVFAGDDAACV